ncbi:unnamed protein product [Rotaria sordida]|uniref:Uncharacterized protein n=1 Tax=Rotaria sordida TaxID=392033 RepID=A0A813MSH4_9BILA|nr:unnamed protein product [Rotaria sordida]
MAKSEVGNKKIKLKSADVAFSTTKSKTISGGISIVVAANGEFKKENNQKITYSLVDADAAKLNANPKAASNLSKLIVSAANSFISLAVPENLGLKKDSFEIELEIIITKSGDGGIEITLFDALELSAKGAYERAVGNTITLTFEIQ